MQSETIVDKLRPGTDFASNSKAFVKKTVMLETLQILGKYKVSGKNAEYIAEYSGDAFNAHYNGDENPAQRPAFNKSNLGLWSRLIFSQLEYVVDGLWMDLPPGDNNVTLNL